MSRNEKEACFCGARHPHTLEVPPREKLIHRFNHFKWAGHDATLSPLLFNSYLQLEDKETCGSIEQASRTGRVVRTPPFRESLWERQLPASIPHLLIREGQPMQLVREIISNSSNGPKVVMLVLAYEPHAIRRLCSRIEAPKWRDRIGIS